MITIYTVDANNVFSGVKLHDPKHALPRCSLTPPPQTSNSQVAFLAGSKWVVLPEYPWTPQPSAEEIQAQIIDATQKRLDDFAKTKGYDSILSACTYATSKVPRLRVEGAYCVDVRDNTWEQLYSLLQEVKTGVRPVPSGFSDIEPLLPVLAWPG